MRPLAVFELEAIIGTRDPMEFIRTKEERYRKLGWAKNPPSRTEAIKTMSKHPELIARPIVVKGRWLVVGFNEEALEGLIQQ